jgi:hypothetical protein
VTQRRVALALALVACRPESPGPPTSARGACTEIGCGPGFVVHIERTPPWPLADYRVEITADDAAILCTTAIPLYCDDPPPCDDPRVQLTEIGCALGTGEHALGSLTFVDAPQQVRVRLLENDVMLAEGAWTPGVKTTHPNGPDCEPACTMAPDVKLVVHAQPSP